MIKIIQEKQREFRKWLKKALHRCPHCNSFKTKYGFWTRGWNNFCEQAYGDFGTSCTNCGHVDWNVPLEKHLKTLPAWCTPHPSRN